MNCCPPPWYKLNLSHSSFDGRVVLTSTRKPRRKIKWVGARRSQYFLSFLLKHSLTVGKIWWLITCWSYGLIWEFGGRVWLSYDRAFREHTAASKITDKSSLNVQLYNFHAAGVSSRPHPSSQNSISSEATGSLSSDVVCRSWNRGTCSWPYSSYMFAHKRSLCHGSHRLWDCHNKDRTRDRKRSCFPSASRDGTTKKHWDSN